MAGLGRSHRHRTVRAASTATGLPRHRRVWRATAQRLDGLIQSQGWPLVGGTPLFRLYDAGDAHAAQARLAAAQIWSRVFTERPGWLRLGLPGDETEWARLAAALAR